LEDLLSESRSSRCEARASNRLTSDITVDESVSKDIRDSVAKLAQLKTALDKLFKRNYLLEWVYQVSVDYSEIFSCRDWFDYYDLYCFNYDEEEEEAVEFSAFSEKCASSDSVDNHPIESTFNATYSSDFMKA
jgi:hypothetical protein